MEERSGEVQDGVGEDLDDAMAALVAKADGAMVVVTTSDGAEQGGCLVGFHSQASIEPVRYAVWLSKANRTYRIALGATHLGVHLLGAGQHDLAELFGGTTGDDVDKFAHCGPVTIEHGVPLLDACPRRFVGRLVDLVDGDGDHVLVLLEPVVAEPGDAAPEVPGDAGVLRLGDASDIVAGHGA